MSLPRNILVATDLSPGAERALDYAVELAAKLDAKIHLVNAIGLQAIGIEYGITLAQEVIDAMLRDNRAALERLVAARAGKAAFAPSQLEIGDPRNVIVGFAEKLHADLLVMGTHGRTGVRRLVLGSVAETVTRTAPCPVLLVRAS